MRRIKLGRNTPKSHRGRRTLIAAGVFGAAAEGVRRFRHRRHSHETEG